MNKTGIAALCSIVLLAFALIPGSARAQGHPGGPPPAGKGPGGSGPSPEAVATFLKLTEAQKAAVGQLHDALESRVDGLLDQQKANHDQLELALQGANPDAAAVGRLVIAGSAIRAQIKAAHDTFDAGFTALLTDEQRTRFGIFKEVLEALHPQEGPPPAGQAALRGTPSMHQSAFVRSAGMRAHRLLASLFHSRS